MPNILYRTRGNSSPSGKPRVYFTCHPDDFDRYFDRICEDIFKTHDCTIYYTEDMTDIIHDEDKPTDLGSMNLFVMPVTFHLLSKPNRAMDDDFSYAQKEHIPVLPFMMESGIDEFYGKPDRFGELQYINPYSHDLTEISYEEKLKKYLESVLISEEMAKRVRAAFDAYIFLSYRKKDRRYANELMRLIHAKPEFRDIAIWYDEFLTPGESFNENIRRMMKESKLFTLLVTPNLLEKPNGKPNYVMEHEYPDARDSGMDILPAEMEETDKDALHAEYAGIPECADPHDDEVFQERLAQTLGKIVHAENDDDPEHNYLIGLAYMEGIDVETDKERGLALITKAAEAELPEAMRKLFDMYFCGQDVGINYTQAAKWAGNLSRYYVHTLGPDHPDTLEACCDYATALSMIGEYKQAADLREKILNIAINADKAILTSPMIIANLAGDYYRLREYEKALVHARCAYQIYKKHSEDDILTLKAMLNLSTIHDQLEQKEEAMELCKQAYDIAVRVYGENHTLTIQAMISLANLHRKAGDLQKAVDLNITAYEIAERVHGEKDTVTIRLMISLAHSYRKLGNSQKVIELRRTIYETQRDMFGPEHPDTLYSMTALADEYNEIGEKRTAEELYHKAYITYYSVFGEEHPDTINAMASLARLHIKHNEYEKALMLEKNVYEYQCSLFGETHEDSLRTLNAIAFCIYHEGKHEEALALLKKNYAFYCDKYGKESPESINLLFGIVKVCVKLEKYALAVESAETVYTYRCDTIGEDHPDSLAVLDLLIAIYFNLGDYGKTAEMHEKVYNISCKKCGEDHPETLEKLELLSIAVDKTNNYEKSIEIHEKICCLKKNLFGEMHSDVFSAESLLALAYDRAGDTYKAIDILKKIYTKRCTVSGDENEDSIMVVHDLAILYRKINDYYNALSLQYDVYSFYYATNGEENDATRHALQILAADYCKIHNYKQAASLFLDLYVVQLRILGKNHAETRKTVQNLVYCKMILHKSRTKIIKYQIIYFIKCFGTSKYSIDTAKVLCDLAKSYEYLGKYRSVIKCCQKAYKIYLRYGDEKNQNKLEDKIDLLKNFML